MSDLAVVTLALAAAAGAWSAAGPHPLVGLGVAAAGMMTRRPWLVVVAVAVLASGLGQRAWAGLTPPEPAPFRGWVTLLSDPVDDDGRIRADVRLHGHHLEATIRGAAAASVAERLAGERLFVAGRVGPPPPHAPWLTVRHVVGRLTVSEVDGWVVGSPVSRLANGVRRTLLRGAASLDPRQRSLFAGFVLGDRRDQPEAITDNFRAAGLSHLLAVSGQNVAFVLALTGPLLRRLDLRSRFIATVATIGFFALITRFEPSVLRASAMAGLAALAATLGRESTSLRLLALAVTGLVLVDPLLVHSVGFQLSVAASASIVMLAPPIARRLPGPRFLGDALAVTIAAQVGVAPVLVATFGGAPVAGLVANPLAVPAAGPVMMWGLSAGLVAGFVGGPVAALIHVPTRLLLAWAAAVADHAAALPLGEVRGGHLLAMGIVAVGFLAWRRTPARLRATLNLAGAALAAVVLVLALAHPAGAAAEVRAGVGVRSPGAARARAPPGRYRHSVDGRRSSRCPDRDIA